MNLNDGGGKRFMKSMWLYALWNRSLGNHKKVKKHN